MRKYKLIIDLR